MAATQTPRRRNRSTSKAEQDKAQREAKAAEAAKQQTPDDEASEEELAAQAQRPSNDPEPEGEQEPEGSEPVEPSGFTVGEVTTLPMIERSSSRASVWTDRLNDAAEKLDAAGFPDKGCVPVLECATPRTAANTANNVRVKIKDEKISGLLPGMFGEKGNLQLVTRGRTILVAMNPKN